MGYKPLLPTDEVSFVAVSYYNNNNRRFGAQIFWGRTQSHADTKVDKWRVKATSCEVLDEFEGKCQFQNLNQQLEYLN